MKFITRLAMLLSFFVMVQSAWAASNNVYVDQIGDGSNINFTQTGQGNNIGDSSTHAGITGNNNQVTVEQIGSQNVAVLNVNGSGNVILSNTAGNNNNTNIQAVSSSAAITDTVNGNTNVVNHTVDGTGSSTVNINSDNNTVNVTNTSTSAMGAESLVNISGGGGNTVGIVQDGAAGSNGHVAELSITGATNNINIQQGGNVDSTVKATVNGSGNTLSVNSNYSGLGVSH